MPRVNMQTTYQVHNFAVDSDIHPAPIKQSVQQVLERAARRTPFSPPKSYPIQIPSPSRPGGLVTVDAGPVTRRILCDEADRVAGACVFGAHINIWAKHQDKLWLHTTYAASNPDIFIDMMLDFNKGVLSPIGQQLPQRAMWLSNARVTICEYDGAFDGYYQALALMTGEKEGVVMARIAQALNSRNAA